MLIDFVVKRREDVVVTDENRDLFNWFGPFKNCSCNIRGEPLKFFFSLRITTFETLSSELGGILILRLEVTLRSSRVICSLITSSLLGFFKSIGTGSSEFSFALCVMLFWS